MCNRFLCYTSKTDTSLYINSAKSRQSCPTLCDPMDCSPHQTSLFKAFSRQEYWSGLPCPSPGDLPNPGIEHVSPALAGELFTTSTTWEAHIYYNIS